MLSDLLDHVAAELAAEYIRLMETAAETECFAPAATAEDFKEAEG